MSNVRWSVDCPDEEGLEVEGRRFSTTDEGLPMMCSLVCKSIGRHIHIDYCRAETPAECRANNEVEHIKATTTRTGSTKGLFDAQLILEAKG
jgi:hypothetical protein